MHQKFKTYFDFDIQNEKFLKQLNNIDINLKIENQTSLIQDL